MRTTVKAAQRLPYQDYMYALIVADAEAEAPTHKQEPIYKQESIH